MLGFIRDDAAEGASFVFTNVLANQPGDRRLFRKIERLAEKRDSVFIPVWLTCDPRELRKRKDRPDRRERLKDIDLTNIKFWTEEFEELKIAHPHALTLDTTRSRPEVTARKILDHVHSVGRGAAE